MLPPTRTIPRIERRMLTAVELTDIETKWRGFMVVKQLIDHIRCLHYQREAAMAWIRARDVEAYRALGGTDE